MGATRVTSETARVPPPASCTRGVPAAVMVTPVTTPVMVCAAVAAWSLVAVVALSVPVTVRNQNGPARPL